MSQKAQELEAAREILAEVFGVGLPEVDEMIRGRLEAEGSKESGVWPRNSHKNSAYFQNCHQCLTSS